MISIGGLQKSSLIDYPEKISAIIFTQGCNFRCPYCHNPELIEGKMEKERGNREQILEFLNSRKDKLDGVVITGGEPTLQKSLPEFIKQIKDMGFLVKLDTNGTNPEMLRQLLDKNLIDYVAMDIKAPLEKYSEVVCSKVDTKNILKSIEILKNSNIDYEFRTTVVKSQLSHADFEKIGEIIKGADKYYLQKFVPTKTADKHFLSEKTYSDEEFKGIIEDLQKYLTYVKLR
ncbi:MAG: anaerobic ribonucleoside-triphosphate reductase activating protein [Candidatus Gastranaerophilaceae bacterium]